MADKDSVKQFDKPDASKPLVKRAQYLKLSDDPILVSVDLVEEISTEDGQRVRVTCRQITITQDKDASGREDTIFEYFPEQEEQIKDSNSTSSWYLLTDYKANKWPQEGIFYWVWKASDGIRWEEA